MGSRSPSAWCRACLPRSQSSSRRARHRRPRARGPVPGAWVRPVDGSVARPFVAPRSRYGAGHRGVDFVAAPGTPVRAANAGEVTFAGDVAGSLHVVVAHPVGCARRRRSSRASPCAAGSKSPAATSSAPPAEGRGPRRRPALRAPGGDRYVDPMVLFAPTDLTRLIRLVPVDEPAQTGFDPPAVESRSLAESLHLPQGVADLDATEESPEPLEAIGDALADVAAVARTLSAPTRAPLEVLGEGASRWWRTSLAGPMVSDGATMAKRLLAWARSLRDCVEDPTPPPGGGGSGHLALTVAGINSSTDRATGTALPLDTDRLGYRAGEVRSFSYAPSGGPYRRSQTWGSLSRAAQALAVQLRALQREQPGREVDLIAHSQGGVVVAEFLAHVYDAGDSTLPPLGTVVTLSSPLQGAPAATALARVRATTTGRAALDGVDRVSGGAIPPTSGTATGQLAESSSLIRGLTATSLPDQIDLTSIGAVDDVIVPADHTARPGARSVTVDPAGLSDHGAIVRDPAALDAARLALEDRPLPCIGIATGVRGAVEPVLISRAERTAGEVGAAAGAASDSLLDLGGSR